VEPAGGGVRGFQALGESAVLVMTFEVPVDLALQGAALEPPDVVGVKAGTVAQIHTRQELSLARFVRLT